MLGGGFVRGHARTAQKQTAAERRRSRTTTAGHIDGGALAIRTLWEGGPQRMLGGGFVRGHARTAQKQTAAERRRSRTTTAGHIDGGALAIRTLWEGGPSECWGEGFFEKPSPYHGSAAQNACRSPVRRSPGLGTGSPPCSRMRDSSRHS
jgi:hypothetical protein